MVNILPAKKLTYQSNKKYVKEHAKKYYIEHREKILNRQNIYDYNNRSKVITHYSENKMNCNYCKENTLQFLTVDHVNGGGKKK